MCGFIKRSIDNPAVKALLEDIGLGNLIYDMPADPFEGGPYSYDPMPGVIIQDQGVNHVVDAMWSYELVQDGGQLKPNTRFSTFNARNLELKRWADPLMHRRGIVIASAIGEANGKKGKDKKQYLMESERGFILGALYKPYLIGDKVHYGMTIITRDPQPGFKDYHPKAFPLFLPHDPAFIRTWLDGNIKSDIAIDEMLNSPRLFTDLQVTQVKTYKRGEPLGESEILLADAA